MRETHQAVLYVHVTSARDVDQQLNAGVEILRVQAAKDQGILVTRHGTGRYSLALSHNVPYGLTQERHV